MPVIPGFPSSSLGIGNNAFPTTSSAPITGGANDLAIFAGNVFVGGGLGYTERLDKDGNRLQLIRELDDQGVLEEVWGQTISGQTGDRFVALQANHNGIARYNGSAPATQVWFVSTTNPPHDLCWLPDGSGLYVAIVPTAGTLDLYKYNLSGTAIDGPHSVAVESGWTNAPVKIDVACDSKTVYYTMQGKKIQRYDMVAHTQRADYEVLASDSPYIYGDLRVMNGGNVIVAMTNTGDGPRRGAAITHDPTLGNVVWIDEVNPSGQYHVYKRRASDGSAILAVVTELDASYTNAVVFSIAAYYQRCSAAPHPFAYVMG